MRKEYILKDLSAGLVAMHLRLKGKSCCMNDVIGRSDRVSGHCSEASFLYLYEVLKITYLKAGGVELIVVMKT